MSLRRRKNTMDSIEISILRAGAATGVAASYLDLPDASVATISGCRELTVLNSY